MVEAKTINTSNLTANVTDEFFSYSPRGELTDVYELTPHSGSGVYYHTTASYWPTGALETLGGIPSVPTIYYGANGAGLDGEGRVTEVTASGTGASPVTSVTYSASSTTNPLGALTGVTFGSADSDSFTYDPNTGRMATYSFSVNSQKDAGTLTWNTNGTLQKVVIADSIPGTSDSQTCNYLYDDLQRLATANCGTPWSQTFTYDTFGNITKSGTSSFIPGYSLTQNQFTSIPGVSVKYDANGNLLTDNLNSYTWDPNWGNMLTVNTGSAIVTATYDALGRMVENNAGGNYTEFVYGPTGAKLAKVNGTTLIKAFVALPGGAKAIYNSTGLAYYRHSDWLGTSRLTSTASRTMYSSSAYAPFGEQYATSGTADASFTGQDQDTVSSLYDFPARRQSSSQGRWISPDPAGRRAVTLANPQSWNRYAYANNNPLALTDPTGLDDCPLADQDANGNCIGDDNNGGGNDDNSGTPPPVDQCDQADGTCPLTIPVQIAADCPPGSNLDPDNEPMVGPGTSFSGPIQAGAAAVAGVNQASQSVGLEYEGFIYQSQDGSYSFTAPNQYGPVSGGGSGGILLPGGVQIVGVYHTHPGGDPNTLPEVFSEADAFAAGSAANGQIGIGGDGVNVLGTPDGNTLAFVGTSPQNGSVTQVSGPGCLEDEGDFGGNQGPVDQGSGDVPAVARPTRRHF
jgi:RHS repeat-associated protein